MERTWHGYLATTFIAWFSAIWVLLGNFPERRVLGAFTFASAISITLITLASIIKEETSK